MKRNRWVETSRRMYTFLLRFYPEDHRNEFGDSMLQVFTDQCRSAYGERGIWGLLILWLRTLLDVGVTSVVEHITSPRAGWGLLEAVPGAPLPWKGVMLVLIPGLVFFVSQIAQLRGEDWFFWVMYRAAYFLILPVLLVWWWKRTFPVWGLIPLGMLYKTLLYLAYRVQLGAINMERPFLGVVISVSKSYASIVKPVTVLAFLGGVYFLLKGLLQRRHLQRTTWMWIAAYALFGFMQPLLSVVGVLRSYEWDWNEAVMGMGPTWFSNVFYWGMFFYAGFFLLILLGTWLARRYGSLALFLPLGYLIPTVLFGRYDEAYHSVALIYWLIPAVLIYRALLTLAAPVWVARTADESAQRRVFAVMLGAAVGVQILTNFLVLAFDCNLLVIPLEGLTWIFQEPMVTATGIGLALALYRQQPSLQQPETHYHALLHGEEV